MIVFNDSYKSEGFEIGIEEANKSTTTTEPNISSCLVLKKSDIFWDEIELTEIAHLIGYPIKR